ncbi:hypothetical protein D5I55_07000 [Chakrabartia godavariana]|nr:hypothetical protein D5I55_07000 [Chakrabartia godavariana]
MQARAADASGAGDAALRAYSAALIAEPGNAVIANRALRQAIENGDRKLALDAARQLETAGALPADVPLLLLGERLQTGDISGARDQAARIEADGNLAFLLPVLNGWIAVAARQPAALSAFDGARKSGLGVGLVNQQRAFAELAAGNPDAGIALIKSIVPSDGRPGFARLLGAATLQRKGRAAAALDMLEGSDQTMALARELLAAGKPIGGAVETPTRGVAFFYASLASDLVRDRAAAFALTLARYAQFLDPQSPFVALAAAQSLAANGLDTEALAALDGIKTGSAYMPLADESRLALLERLGRGADAVTLATVLAAGSTRAADHVRLGDLLGRLDRRAEAATAYQAAIDAPDQAGAPAPWGLHMLKGSALVQNGDWEGGRSALRKAVELGPDQATALNFLGYSMLERREDIPEALRLIAKASTLRPDDTAITDSLGWAYFLSGDYDKAVSTLEKAVDLEPVEPTIGEHLGDAYWRAGRKIDARYTWRAALLLTEGKDATRLQDKIDMGLTDKNIAR